MFGNETLLFFLGSLIYSGDPGKQVMSHELIHNRRLLTIEAFVGLVIHRKCHNLESMSVLAMYALP